MKIQHTPRTPTGQHYFGNFRTRIVGLQYAAAAAVAEDNAQLVREAHNAFYKRHVAAAAVADDNAQLAREAHNAFDNRAIRADNALGAQVGYLPREVVCHVAPLDDSGRLHLNVQKCSVKTGTEAAEGAGSSAQVEGVKGVDGVEGVEGVDPHVATQLHASTCLIAAAFTRVTYSDHSFEPGEHVFLVRELGNAFDQWSGMHVVTRVDNARGEKVGYLPRDQVTRHVAPLVDAGRLRLSGVVGAVQDYAQPLLIECYGIMADAELVLSALAAAGRYERLCVCLWLCVMPLCSFPAL
ncbi:hypothetical protein FOA52_009922 [Chlamydomonas sp. UWO 241]|nr:hypothetical protein FOA52_009922 [Chlamydomonas sp. UWO 241]